MTQGNRELESDFPMPGPPQVTKPVLAAPVLGHPGFSAGNEMGRGHFQSVFLPTQGENEKPLCSSDCCDNMGHLELPETSCFQTELSCP